MSTALSGSNFINQMKIKAWQAVAGMTHVTEGRQLQRLCENRQNLFKTCLETQTLPGINCHGFILLHFYP